MPAECCKKFWNRIPDDVPVFTVVMDEYAAANADKMKLPD